MSTEFKRVKHGHTPGDLPRRIKIAMREKRVPVKVFSWQIITVNQAKSFRRDLIKKSKTVQRRRDRMLEHGT